MDNIYDLVIIGGGPAGMTAGIYASRARMKTLLVERAVCGGQTLTADTVENFPGFPDGVKGQDLAKWIFKQAEHFGLETKQEEVSSITLKMDEGSPFVVTLADKKEIHAISIVVATGARWNTLNIPGEDEFRGKGVSYCATCDGPLFKGKDVVVIGGGNTALEDAMFLTRFVNSVRVIHRKSMLRATKILQEKASANKKINFHLNSIATEIRGRKRVEGVMVKDVNTGREGLLKCDGVFVFIGIVPNSGIVKDIVETNEKGYIISDAEMCTSVDGIFVCGDVREKALRQIVTAAGEGATAAFSAEHYVNRIKGTEYK